MAISDINLKTARIKPEDLVEDEYFGQGVHEVIISNAEFFKDDKNDKIYLDVDVADEQNIRKAQVRMFFTEKANKITISTIRRILVHNAEDENKKQEIRIKFQTVTSLLDLKAFVMDLIGKQAWLKIEKSDRTYIDNDGNEKFSYNRNLYGYEPEMTIQKKKMDTDNDVATSQEMLPTEQEVDNMGGMEINMADVPF